MGRMNIMAITRRHYLALASSLALLLAVYGCGGHDNTALVAPEGDASSPQERSLRPANPCADAGGAIDPCESRDVSGYDLFSAQPGGGVSHFTLKAEAPAVEEVLERGLLLAEASPVHLAFRGTTTRPGLPMGAGSHSSGVITTGTVTARSEPCWKMAQTNRIFAWTGPPIRPHGAAWMLTM